jgi:hypothetical protein
LPSDAIAYLHIAGGHVSDGFRHDTHAQPVAAATLAMAHATLAHIGPRLVMLERDDAFGTRNSFDQELDLLAAAFPPGPPYRFPTRVPPNHATDRPSPDIMSDIEERLIQAVFDSAQPPDGFDAATLKRLQHKLKTKAAWVASRRARATAAPTTSRKSFWERLRRRV